MIPDKLLRPTREEEPKLFDVGDNWGEYWWGMPEFNMKDASPQYRITVNFMTADDVKAFAKATGTNVTPRSNSIWFPHQPRLFGDFIYDGPKTDSRYPVCIPSKGRAQYQTTGKLLSRMGVSHKFFVEETEADAYRLAVGEENVVVMPFHDLGQGSIPARNFIWEWCKEREYKRHWVVDDNIVAFARCHNNRRIYVFGGGFFNAMEDFVDRYENIKIAGPHHDGFILDRRVLAPVRWNGRVYSCILIDTTMDIRWRGRYNEDTDLCLRVLKDGHCTALFRALLMHKSATVGYRSAKKPLPGGNTDNVYNTGDHRLAFARSLQSQHPDCVQVVWKFNRWHHQVDYSPFRKNKPILKPGITPIATHNNYGMELVRVKG